MESTISITDAGFSYGDGDVFTGINLEVSKGEMLCLLGANGCGKTTLLHCVSGALKLKSGKVKLDGRDIASMKASQIARKVGFVFQEHSAPFPYPVIDVVCMGRAPHLSMFSAPSREDRRIAEESLEKVGMLHLRDKPYTKISGGERQLVLIARTIAQQPEVILLDEPTSHLDFKNQTLILRMISRLAKQGLSIMMSSHLPNHALLFSSKVALLCGGGILATGNPDDVITEESLREVYGIDVRIFKGRDGTGSDEIKFCMPSLEPAEVLTSTSDGIDNVFEGDCRIEDDIGSINIGNGTVIEAVTKLEGKVKVYLPSDDVIVSGQPMASSSRNLLRGRVTGVFQKDMVVNLEVDAGRKVIAKITKKSFVELKLAVGTEVYITFKASALQVFPMRQAVTR